MKQTANKQEKLGKALNIYNQLAVFISVKLDLHKREGPKNLAAHSSEFIVQLMNSKQHFLHQKKKNKSSAVMPRPDNPYSRFKTLNNASKKLLALFALSLRSLFRCSL